VYEAPDDMTAASVAMAVAAAGEVRSGKTTRLLSGQEWLEGLRKRRIVNVRKAHEPHEHRHQMPELLHCRACKRGQACSTSPALNPPAHPLMPSRPGVTPGRRNRQNDRA
jgi:hypothetical protein